MTANQALETLIKHFPDSYVSVTATLTSHVNEGGNRRQPVGEISVYTSRSKRKCYEASTIEGAVTECLEDNGKVWNAKVEKAAEIIDAIGAPGAGN